LSDTRVSDKVRWVRSGSVQITLVGPDRLSLVGSGRVVSKFHYTDPTRPDPDRLDLRTHPRTLSGRRLVRSISTCTDFVRGSDLVGLQTKSVGPGSGICHGPDCRRPGRRRGHVWSGPVRVVEFTNDTTRPDQPQSLVGPVPNSTTRTRTRPDPATKEKKSCLFSCDFSGWYTTSEKSLKLLSPDVIFNAKMHQIRLRLGCAPDLAGGAYSAPTDPLSGFKGPTSKVKEGKGKGLRGGEGKG